MIRQAGKKTVYNKKSAASQQLAMIPDEISLSQGAATNPSVTAKDG